MRADDLLDDALIVVTADHGEMLESDAVLTRQLGHFGNPSFEPVLRVPLIFSPAVDLPNDRWIRTDQLAALLLRSVAAEPPAPAAGDPLLADDEMFTSEVSWRTYRRGRWKSAWRRDGKTTHLFDLELGEGEDVAASHPEILAEHRARLDEILRQLHDPAALPPGELSPGDYERLKALGYAD